MNDIELAYTEQGSGEALVLLHGNGEDRTYFAGQTGKKLKNKSPV